MSKITPIPQNTFISFKGNKTKEQAVLEKSNNCVNITNTGELYFNGKRLGTNDTEDKFFDSKAINTDGTINAANVKASDGKNIENYIQDKINTGVSGAYKFKKSIPSLSSAFRLNCQVGDIFNITNEFTITSGDHAGKYPAGTNVAVNTAFAGQTGGHDAQGKETYFDPLGGVVTDLSNYVTTDTLNTTKTELSDRIDECAKTVDVKRDYLSRNDFNDTMLDYNKTLVLNKSEFPEETKGATNSMSQSELEFFKKINDAIRNHKQIVIVESGTTDVSYYLVNFASSDFVTLGNKLHILLQYINAGMVSSIDISTVNNNTSYSLEETNTHSATEEALEALRTEVNNLKEQLKLA